MEGEKKIRRPNRNTSRDCAGEADGDPTALSHQCPSREWSSNRTPERAWGGARPESIYPWDSEEIGLAAIPLVSTVPWQVAHEGE